MMAFNADHGTSEPSVNPVAWGVLGVANIALTKVIPGMQKGRLSRVVACASRDREKARSSAETLAIPRAYASYDALLDDPEVEAVYNPLPNHLHVPWSIRAVEAGKHVLCEKPITLTAAEAMRLRDAAARAGVLVGEAFMVRAHPQWLEVKRLVDSGRIGALQLMHGHFSYGRRDRRTCGAAWSMAGACCWTSAATRSTSRAGCSARSRWPPSRRSTATRRLVSIG
jgi:predicted dehydrogenase